jgi:SAM-dependent methyltransferase
VTSSSANPLRAARAGDGNTFFYEVTSGWVGRSVSKRDKARADLMEAILRGKKGKILELGCGSGGTSVALARSGHHVFAVERSLSRADIARDLAIAQRVSTVQIIHADFNTLDLGAEFDLVCYWSGFGAGDDDAQLNLLRRIRGWIKPTGQALIEVFDPGWWAGASGMTRFVGRGLRQELGFEAETSHLTVTYRGEGAVNSFGVVERLRCYGRSEMSVMAQNCRLHIKYIPFSRDDLRDYSYLVELKRL